MVDCCDTNVGAGEGETKDGSTWTLAGRVGGGLRGCRIGDECKVASEQRSDKRKAHQCDQTR